MAARFTEWYLVLMPVPDRPKIYHITAIANLRRIVPDEELVSDAVMIERGGPKVEVGMSNIKKARLRAARRLPSRADGWGLRSVLLLF